MAKKTTKQATEIKTIDQMRADIITAQNDMNEAKRGHKMGELTNPRVITSTRKKIARLHTAIRAAQIAEQKESK
ncbi:MAG: 50S ribosomal protein L29 [Candidatus Saccharibacteria bacterium]